MPLIELWREVELMRDLACAIWLYSHCRQTHNGPGFSRVDRDAMMTQLGGQESSGPRRLQPRVRRAVRSPRHAAIVRCFHASLQASGMRPRTNHYPDAGRVLRLDRCGYTITGQCEHAANRARFQSARKNVGCAWRICTDERPHDRTELIVCAEVRGCGQGAKLDASKRLAKSFPLVVGVVSSLLHGRLTSLRFTGANRAR